MMNLQSVNSMLSGSSFTPEGYLLIAVALGALPLLLAVGTCYLKFSIVLGMLRSGFGTQQTPSNALVVSLSVVMSLIVMQPVISAVIERAESVKMVELSKAPLTRLYKEGRAVISPWVEFLTRAAGTKELEVFSNLTLPKGDSANEGVHTLPAIIGAFVVTEIKRGFLISFALLIPFFVVDLVVSNLLVGMGLTMMSPVIVSLPIKVLLFISADGWLLLVQTLIQGYQQ